MATVRLRLSLSLRNGRKVPRMRRRHFWHMRPPPGRWPEA